jgi:hypothetical protein
VRRKKRLPCIPRLKSRGKADADEQAVHDKTIHEWHIIYSYKPSQQHLLEKVLQEEVGDN